jgi:DNA invertase Pin-like site-specific DNA recombinase
VRYGYARVSSKMQDHTAQIEALKAAGCDKVYSEKRSGKDIEGRPEFVKLMKALQPGDVIVVCKLDRLARSSRDLANIVHDIGEAGAGFVSLGDSWCDTTSSVGRLVFTIMSGMVQFERELIRARCDAGIERAKQKGVQFGRPARLSASEKRKIAERHAAGETIPALAAEYEVGLATIHRALG